jgi:hypothetical protein
LQGFTIVNGSVMYGGGVNIAASNTVIAGCVLGGNIGQFGGALYINADTTVSNCVMTNNYASANGGAFYSQACIARIVNCLMAGNQCANAGGAVFCNASTTVLENCTITGNKAPAANCGGVYLNSGATLLRNSIIYNNLAGAVTSNFNGGVFSNCCTTPLPAGTNNIISDPLFLSPGSGSGTNFTGWNCRLFSLSPCVNAGTNQSWMLYSSDLDGNPRIIGRSVDMGAYEYMPPAGTLLILR